MLGPQALATLVARRLRYFSYEPMAGGHGGDYDFLTAYTQPLADDARARLRAALDAGAVPQYGFYELFGARWRFEEAADRHAPANAPVPMKIDTIYITEAVVTGARDLEDWLLGLGIPMAPRPQS